MNGNFKRWVKRLLNAHSPTLSLRLRNAWQRRRPRVGFGSHVDPTAHFIGAEFIEIGANTVVSEYAYFNVNQKPTLGSMAISIGDDTFVGRRNFFSSGASIDIGSYVLTAIDCKFIGSSHIVDDPDVPVGTSGTTGRWRIRVGTNTFVGAGATLLGDVDVGHGCVIGALALVTGRVPPFSMTVGNPARIVKRYSWRLRAWVPIADFEPADEETMPTEAAYLERLRQTHGHPPMPYAAAGRHTGHL